VEHRRVVLGEEAGEVLDREHVDADRVEGAAGGQPVPGPAFGRLPQPRRVDLGEADPATAAGRGNTQFRGAPGVGGVAAFQVIADRVNQP
jgi:hypothetical protein